MSSLVFFYIALKCVLCDVMLENSDEKIVLSSQNLPQSEIDILLDLYTATNGSDWKWNPDPASGIPWNFTDPYPCSDHWQAVDCYFYENSYHVMVLHPQGLNLAGTLPESLGNLSYVLSLDFTDNKIHGTIPISFGNLTLLQGIILAENEMSGVLPDSLSQLSQLSFLNGQFNAFEGTIPESYSKLTNLRYFLFENNFLSGTLPASVFMAMPHLTFIFLSVNCFHGTIPGELGLLQELAVFEMAYNQLTGE